MLVRPEVVFKLRMSEHKTAIHTKNEYALAKHCLETWVPSGLRFVGVEQVTAPRGRNLPSYSPNVRCFGSMSSTPCSHMDSKMISLLNPSSDHINPGVLMLYTV